MELPSSHRPSTASRSPDSRRPSILKPPDSRRPSILKPPDSRRPSTASSKPPDSRKPSVVILRPSSASSKQTDSRKSSVYARLSDGSPLSATPRRLDGRQLSALSGQPSAFMPRDGRLQSLGSRLLPQGGSSLVPPGRVSISTDPLRSQDQVQAPADKVKDKESAGTRLLSMLRKTLQGSQSEEMVVTRETPTLVPFGDVVGCLAVHIKNCRQFTHRISLQQYTNLFIRISINHIVKCTKTQSLMSTNTEKNPVIKFDEVKYFSVQVPRRQDDERNNIFMELMQDGNTEKHPLFLGSVEVHLYEVIQFICRLEVAFMFSYGNFGYGFSHQLKPLQKIIQPSMFMNIAPPLERADPLTNVITPQPVEYPAFLSPDLKATIGTSADTRRPDQPAVQLEKLKQPPRERLEKMKKEYRNLNTWIEKVEYLRSIINPKSDYKEPKESNITLTLEQNSNLFEMEPENISTLDFRRINSKAEVTPSEEELHPVNSEYLSKPVKSKSFFSTVTELLENEEKKGLITPIMKLSDQDSSVAAAYRRDESSTTDISFPPIHTLERRDEDTMPYLYARDSEVMPVGQRKSVLFASDEKLVQKYPSILKTSSSLQQARNKEEKSLHFSDVLITPTQPLGYENSKKKEKSVAVSHKQYTSPFYNPEYIKFKPKYQFQKISKSGFDPFLRNISGKMSFRKNDQNIYKYSNIVSAEAVEHEDQDPPYPERLKATGSHNATWANDPNLITIQMVDMKNKLSPNLAVNPAKASESSLGRDPTITTKASDTRNKLSCDPSITRTKTSYNNNNVSPDPSNTRTKTSDSKNKLSHDPSNTRTKTSDSKNKLSHDPPITGTKTTDTEKQLELGPNITMKTSGVQNKLQERLPAVSLPNFKGESSMTGNVNTYRPSKSLDFTSDIENLKQSMVLKSILSKNLQDLSDLLFYRPEMYMNMETIEKKSSFLAGIHDTPSSSMEDKVFERIQDVNSWHSAKDILNSQSLLSLVIKNMVIDLLSEGEPGKSPEEEGISKTHVGTAERNFPMSKKSSFKKKHLITGVSSNPGFSGSVHDYDHFIKQIFTAPIFSPSGTGVKELSEAQMSLQGQLSTPWEKNVSSISLNHEENYDDTQLSQPRSVINQIIQSFSLDSLLESGIIKVIELDKEYQCSLLDTGITSPEKEPKNSIEYHSDVKSETQCLSGQDTPVIPQENTSSVGRVEFVESSPNMSLQDSKYSIPDKKPELPNEEEKLDREESDLNSTLENLSNSLGKLNESDMTLLKSFLKNIFKIFFKYNQFQRRQQPEKELEKLIQNSFPSGTKHFEEIQGSFSKADKLDQTPILSSKLRVFLEELSDSEVKNLTSELSKHIQHYLLERLSESGHIAKEDLPKIYQNLYLMNKETELKEQNNFQEKYSETVKEILSFVNNFNHNFIEKHLEIKLRSFLNEILQNYFLKNLSESSLFSEAEAVTVHSNASSLRSAPVSLNGLEQDISRGSFGRRLEINMKYPLNKTLQKYLRTLSGNEWLNLKADVSKYLQNLLIDKLSKSGLMTEKQVKRISQHMKELNSNSTSIPLKYIKTDLSFRDENYFMREKNEDSKIGQVSTLQKASEKYRETEPIRKEETGNPFLNNFEENPSKVCEQKDDYSKEDKTLSLIKAPSSSHKNFQAIPFKKPSERLTDVLLNKHKKEHGVMQVPQAENSVYTPEIQDPYTCDDQSKVIQPRACFERTLKVKPLGKGENGNVYKLFVQDTPEAGLLLFPRIPNYKMSKEDECCTLTFPTWQSNTLMSANSDSQEQSKLDRYCQRLRGNNNNNKKHLVTFAQFKNEIETLYIDPHESFSGKYNKFHEPQSCNYKEDEKNSRPFFFPDVLKKENMKLKTRKEKDHVPKPKTSFHKIVRLLPATLPTARTHLKKSIPKTLLHWTARRTIHDCFEKFEDLHVPSIKHPKKSKSRARLGKTPDNIHHQAKHCARPYTAPETNKRQGSATGKVANPRLVSAGLVHINDATSDYEMCKTQPKQS